MFLSYAREDRATAEKLAAALMAAGYDVFWDRKITTGQLWDEVLARELQAAERIVVLWSKHSVNSRWVRAEAAEAAERGVLLPAAIEPDVRIPFQYKPIQTVDLTTWNGTSDDPAFQGLVHGLEDSRIQPTLPGQPTHGGVRRKRLKHYGIGVLTALMAIAVVLYGIGRDRGWFSIKVPYHTLLESSEGLKVGDPVLLDGKPVGEIALVELAPPDAAYNVFVGFTVRDPYFGFVWSDSRARVSWHPSKERRSIQLTRGGTTTNSPVHSSYQVDPKTGSTRFWDEKEQTYQPVGTHGQRMWGFLVHADEVPEVPPGTTPEPAAGLSRTHPPEPRQRS